MIDKRCTNRVNAKFMRHQRGFAVTLILYGIAVAAVAGALYGAWYSLDHWENSAVRKAQASALERIAQVERERDAALEMVNEYAEKEVAAKALATDLAMLWSAQVDKTEAASRQRKEAHEATFVALQTRARAVSPSANVRFSADAFRLFNDASTAANAAGSTQRTEAAPADVPDASEAHTYRQFNEGEFRTFVVVAAQAYADCRAQLHGVVTFYEALRDEWKKLSQSSPTK